MGSGNQQLEKRLRDKMSELKIASEIALGPDFAKELFDPNDDWAPDDLLLETRLRLKHLSSPDPESSSFILASALEVEKSLINLDSSFDRWGVSAIGSIGSSYRKFEMLFDFGSRLDLYNKGDANPLNHSVAVLARPQVGLEIGTTRFFTALEASFGLAQTQNNDSLPHVHVQPSVGISFSGSPKKKKKAPSPTLQPYIPLHTENESSPTLYPERPFNVLKSRIIVERGQQTLRIPFEGDARDLKIYDDAGRGHDLHYIVTGQGELLVILKKPILKAARYTLLLRSKTNGVYLTIELPQKTPNTDQPINLNDRE